VNLVYLKIYYYLIYIFMNPLLEAKFLKLHAMIGLQEATIMGVRARVISPLESMESCVDGGLLEK
jgi:hypothetical protein